MCVQFSAMHSRRLSGKKKFISDGASASGVFWKMIRIPSTSSSSPVWMDRLGRSDEPRRADRCGLAEACVDLPLWPERQQRPELIQRTSGHDRAGEDVLAHRFSHEPFRCDHSHVAGVDGFSGGDAEHAAEVIDVAVGVDDRRHRALAEGVVGEFEAGAGALLAGERVDDQPAAVRRDEGDVAEVVAAGLPDTVGDLEQPVHRIEPTLAPQPGMHGVGGGIVRAQEIVVGDVPDRSSSAFEASGRMLGDQAARCRSEIGPVIEVDERG